MAARRAYDYRLSCLFLYGFRNNNLIPHILWETRGEKTIWSTYGNRRRGR
jgi:hypothetical protein